MSQPTNAIEGAILKAIELEIEKAKQKIVDDLTAQATKIFQEAAMSIVSRAASRIKVVLQQQVAPVNLDDKLILNVRMDIKS